MNYTPHEGKNMLIHVNAIKFNKLHWLTLALFLSAPHNSVYAVGNDEAKVRNGEITTIVLHAIGGPRCTDNEVEFTGAPGDAKRWVGYFEGKNNISIHYVVDRQGNVEAGIAENRVAWHARGNNSKSIGIELVNRGDGQEAYPAQQVAALVELVSGIKRRHPDIVNIVRHSDIDDRTFPCGGRTVDLKQDPGRKFPFDQFLSSVGM
ncbi:MAG: N-acetylmuramoyl-L-alanine amidase [Gammaproteobacteria bacterium]|nr:N-acetylmuramoyl-L-alanine amidase [Gammaproteobacteria bacterium]